MSRASKAIEMLDILKKNDIVSKDELAFRLNTNKRYITELRKEIEAAGYKITVKLTEPSGYCLQKEVSDVKKTDDNLLFVHNFISNLNYFPQKNDCLESLEKYVETGNYEQVPHIELNQTMYRKKRSIQKNMDILYEGIKQSRKLDVQFLNNFGKYEVICFMPYSFYLEKDIWYCLGKTENHSKIETVKLLIANIKNIKFTDLKFKKSEVMKKEKEPAVYYHAELVVRDRWDLFYVKFGISNQFKILNDRDFEIIFNTFFKDELNKIINDLGPNIVSYKVSEETE